MRILIDASSLLLRSAGVKNYTWHWIRHLRRAAGGHRIDAFPFLDELGELRHDASVLPRWKTLPRLAALFLSNRPWTGVLNRIAAGADLVHMSNLLRYPPSHARVTATLYDLTALTMPELHTRGNVRADTYFRAGVLERAAGLIAISESTKRDAVRVLGIAPEKIRVIYPGVPTEYFLAKAADHPARPYILFLGTIEPRKNLDRLLDAYSSLAMRGEIDLVVAGPPGWSSEATLARLNATPGVRYRGYVPEADLPALVAGAMTLAYPSLYEGFGFPLAQAMAAGTPVVTSNVSSLPEVAGDAALFVDPSSVSDIRTALERVISSAALRRTLSEAGRRRAELFRWERCARESIAFFEALA